MRYCSDGCAIAHGVGGKGKCGDPYRYFNTHGVFRIWAQSFQKTGGGGGGS